MRRFLVATAALVAFVSSTAAEPVIPMPHAESTVRIALENGHGSGVYIGNGFVLTASHVTKDEKTIQVVLTDGRKINATVVLFDSVDDVSILSIPDGPGIDAAKLACRAPVIGESIEIHGDPLQLNNVVSFGRISGLPRQVGPWRLATVVDATIAPGNSGGPMFDAKGEVLGLVVGEPAQPVLGGEVPYAFALAVPSTTLCALRDALGGLKVAAKD